MKKQSQKVNFIFILTIFSYYYWKTLPPLLCLTVSRLSFFFSVSSCMPHLFLCFVLWFSLSPFNSTSLGYSTSSAAFFAILGLTQQEPSISHSLYNLALYLYTPCFSRGTICWLLVIHQNITLYPRSLIDILVFLW